MYKSKIDSYLKARYIINQRRARREGIERTTRLHNYQINVLISMAVRQLMTYCPNEEVKDVVLSLEKIQRKGFFDDDNS